MAVGDQSDMLTRLQRLLPTGWFGDDNPIRDALLWGCAQAQAWCYTLYLYAQAQTRIKTATDSWLDLIALDFFGDSLTRRLNQGDNSYRSTILVNLFRERTTRHAMEQVLLDLTGRAPVIIEPARPADVGAYGAATSVLRSSTASYIDINGGLRYAGPNVVRYDTDQQSKVSRLLVESSATNLITYSNDLLAGWLKSGVSVFSDGTLDPSGRQAFKVVEDATLAAHRVRATLSSLASGQVIVASVFAKAAERQFLQIAFGSGSTGIGPGYVNFDLVNGIYSEGSGAVGSMTSVGSGWYRCSCSLPVTGDGSTAQVYNSITTSLAVTRLPSHQGVSGSGLYLFGAQGELDAMTSYIPTTSATATRAADVLLTNMPTNSAALGGYKVAGAYGSVSLTYQAFITAYRPTGQGLPYIAGYGTTTGGYSTPSRSDYAEYTADGVSDADIYAAIAATKPEGTAVWARISN